MIRSITMFGLLLCCAAGCAVPVFAEEGHAPIPITFELPEPAFVTLVIEDSAGVRVRNLVSETPFRKGTNTIYWDGLDDINVDHEAAGHAIYSISGRSVEPGAYTVRGLRRKAVDLIYEFAVYNPGKPAWQTKDTSSEWLTNHSPPCTVCFIPPGAAPVRGDKGSPGQVLIGSFVAEGGSGLAWVDLDGRKLHGQMWVGGVWTGAEQVARDTGDAPLPGAYAYVASAWKGDKYNEFQAEIRLHKLVNDEQKLDAPRDRRFGHGEDPPVLEPTWKFPEAEMLGVSGLAAWNGLVVISLTKMDKLLLVDATKPAAIGTFPLEAPRGLTFDPQGRLLAVSGSRVVRIDLPPRRQCTADTKLPDPQVIVADGLEEPQQITLDENGDMYVSDWGASNNVKVFTPAGKLARTIGTAGAIVSGPYDPTMMHRPDGITIDGRGHLWVAEKDHQPKRVSIWTTDGKLVNAFYGPPRYGGGGVLDPEDRSLFYLNGMTFKLDWQTGDCTPSAIRWRPGPDDFKLPGGHHADGPPDMPIYRDGRKYFTNCFTSSPTNGPQATCLWIEEDGVCKPVAAAGNARFWDWLLKEPQRNRITFAEKPDEERQLRESRFMFIWSDLNGDGAGQIEEVQVAAKTIGTCVMFGPELSIITGEAGRFAPKRFTAGGAPEYDLATAEVLCPGAQRPASTGGGQMLAGEDGWLVLTTAPEPFSRYAVGGARNGKPRWSYPSPWPGLHASHISPMPEFPGELIGTTRLIGPAFSLPGTDVELWAVNGNKGSIYLFTMDGLFVATLFQDGRTPDSSWSTRPQAVRGMSVSNLTNGEECFWPTITSTSDGKVYVVTRYPAIIRVDGLETIRRIPPNRLQVTADQLAQARAYHLEQELKRQAEKNVQTKLVVPLRDPADGQAAPAVDGKLDEWDADQFVTIDERKKSTGDWSRKTLQTTAALAVSGDRLYGAVRTGEGGALDNAGTSLHNLFKTGGAIDLMLGTDPGADPKRRRAVAGDVRLLIAKVDRKPIAVLYRHVVPGHKGDRVPFSSTLRTLYFDEVRDVSGQITFAQGASAGDKRVVPDPAGDFEFSVPLSLLGLKPKPGLTIRGDIGVLRGSHIQTTQRAYWTNKAAGLVSDIPSEAELTPHLWGTILFGEN